MQVKVHGLAAAVVIVMASALVVVAAPGQLSAAGPLQAGSESPEIAEPECSFWLDHDTDGEGDEPFVTDPGSLALQQSPVVGGCTFKLNAPDEATLLVASELVDWEVEVELKREPGGAEEFKMYPGRTEIPGVQGRMRVIANFAKGATPRSGKSRTLPDGYRHEAQIPKEFRLIEITVTTPDGRKDRLERNATSASGAFISAHRLVSDGNIGAPAWTVALAEEWLEQGYPQVSDSLMAADSANSGAGSGGVNWWMWIAIATWGVTAGGLIAAAAVFILMNNNMGQTKGSGSRKFDPL